MSDTTLRDHYSTIIIGAGPGGYELAALLSSKGEQVALIDSHGLDGLGGTCLNRGCIPTKTLAHAAELAAAASEGAVYGINLDTSSIDWPTLMVRKQEVIDRLRQGIAMSLNKVDIIEATASLMPDKAVALLTTDGASSRAITADRIVIATGSTAATLPIPGADQALSSDHLQQLRSLPKSIIIIGGGVIGMEFASIFSLLGSEVTVIEYAKEILPPFDKDIAKRLRTALADRGVKFHLSAQAIAIDDHRVDFLVKGKEETAEAEVIAMAVGRRPNLPEGLEKAGVEHDRRGIQVDPSTYQTTAEGIFAIGDVNGISMLAHAASAQARRIAGADIATDIIPAAVFTLPEAAMVGLTEEQCKAAGHDYKAVKLPFRGNGKAVSMNQDSGLLKLIIDNNDRRILGCHITGPHAADMIQTVAMAMANGLTVDAIARTIHIHPTLSEMLLTAAERF